MAKKAEIKAELLNELLGGRTSAKELLGEEGLFKQLKKALLERALGAELTHHLGYERGDAAGRGSGNSRNGSSSKTIETDDGPLGGTWSERAAGMCDPGWD